MHLQCQVWRGDNQFAKVSPLTILHYTLGPKLGLQLLSDMMYSFVHVVVPG